MNQETEVKIPIESGEISQIQERLLSLGFELTTDRTYEENFLFDTGPGELAERGCALRLRRFGEKFVLTYKGPRVEDSHMKIREEIESRVTDFDNVKSILEALGYKAVFRYQKYRRKLHRSEEGSLTEVCIDETPVGCFVEIEGTPAAIEQYARRLGWSPSQFITANYVDLYRKKGYGEL